jgi:hypothetical protein
MGFRFDMAVLRSVTIAAGLALAPPAHYLK